MSEPSTNNRGPSVISKLREIAGFTLVGSVIAGAFFSWIPIRVDVHAIGAGIGAVIGVIGVLKSPRE